MRWNLSPKATRNQQRLRMATIDLKNFKNKKVLVIFPHPDDETVMAGGLIQRLLSFSAKVAVVCLTAGDQGKIHVHGRGQSLGQIRRGEFISAVKRLDVENYEIFNFPDGKLKDSPVWKPVVREYINHYDLVVSYDPSGVTGHPDHIALSLFLMKVAKETGGKLLLVAPAGIIRSKFLDPRVLPFATTPQLLVHLSLGERLRKWWAFNGYPSQYDRRTRLFALLLSLKPQLEGFAQFNSKKKYPHRYVNFEF